MNTKWIAGAMLLAGSTVLMAADGAWLRKVPQTDRERSNPYAGKADAAEAGRNLYAQNCAKCHGQDGGGHNGRPSLRSERVQHATDGELAWILRNGSVWHGMPSWTSLPEPERWQIVTFIRTLPADQTNAKH